MMVYFEGPDGMVYEYSVGVKHIMPEQEATYRPRQFSVEGYNGDMWGSFTETRACRANRRTGRRSGWWCKLHAVHVSALKPARWRCPRVKSGPGFCNPYSKQWVPSARRLAESRGGASGGVRGETPALLFKPTVPQRNLTCVKEPHMPSPAPMTAGVTQQGSSVDGIVWHILGQTYTPLQVTESSFAWHALLPPGTFVPPHIHPTQDEFIYVFEGRFDLVLDGQSANASAGDLIRLPRGIPHGLFNNSQANITCLFWVSPTRRLWDLFQAIDNVADPAEVVRLAGLHEVNFLPPPG